MGFVIIALTLLLGSTLASLLFGRLLARASAEQTFNPRAVRGPSVEADLQAHRLDIAEKAASRRSVEVHLN